jgi:hypothetical protein
MTFSAFASVIATTTALMVALFLVSHVTLRYGLLPMSAALSLSGFNLALFYLLILPGTVIHELSHLGACALMGVRIRQARLFAPQADGTLGWVEYDRTDIVRRNIIAFAPFLGGSLALYALARIALPNGDDLLPPLAPDKNVAQTFVTAVTGTITILSQMDVQRVTTWLFLYGVFSLGFAISPSRTDFAELSADGAILTGIGLFLALVDYQLGLGLGHNALVLTILGTLTALLSVINSLLLFSLVVTLVGAGMLVTFAFILQAIRGGE